MYGGGKDIMKHWTNAEREILKNYYYTLSPEELEAKLPERTRSAIYNQVTYLRARGWTFNKGPKGETNARV